MQTDELLGLPMSLVAADVSPLDLNSMKVRADSRRLPRSGGTLRELCRGILPPSEGGRIGIDNFVLN